MSDEYDKKELRERFRESGSELGPRDPLDVRNFTEARLKLLKEIEAKHNHSARLTHDLDEPMRTLTAREVFEKDASKIRNRYSTEGVAGPEGNVGPIGDPGPQGIQYAGVGLNWTPPFYFQELRDKFAMAALPALIEKYAHGADVACFLTPTMADISEAAYRLADAMIKARETKTG